MLLTIIACQTSSLTLTYLPKPFTVQVELVVLECFQVTSRWPYWCPKQILWELNSYLKKTLSFVPINLQRCHRSENALLTNRVVCTSCDNSLEKSFIQISSFSEHLCASFIKKGQIPPRIHCENNANKQKSSIGI